MNFVRQYHQAIGHLDFAATLDRKTLQNGVLIYHLACLVAQAEMDASAKLMHDDATVELAFLGLLAIEDALEDT